MMATIENKLIYLENVSSFVETYFPLKKTNNLACKVIFRTSGNIIATGRNIFLSVKIIFLVVKTYFPPVETQILL